MEKNLTELAGEAMNDPTNAPVELDPEQQDREIFEAFQQTTNDLRQIDRQLQELENRRSAILADAGRGSVQERLKVLDDLETSRSNILLHRATARSEWLLLSDAAVGIQVRGRSRHAAELQAQLAEIAARERDLQAEITEHSRAIETLTEEAQPLAEQRRLLTTQMVDLEPKLRHVRINLHDVDPFRLPPNLLIRGTEWAECIAAARSKGLDRLEIDVDETTGTITRSSLDE